MDVAIIILVAITTIIIKDIVRKKRRQKALKRLKSLPTFDTTLLAVGNHKSITEYKEDKNH